MTIIEQRAAGRPGPCKDCKGRKSCCSAVALICPAFVAWTEALCEQRAHEEYREHLRWCERMVSWKDEKNQSRNRRR